jgi:hypothetical protein
MDVCKYLVLTLRATDRGVRRVHAHQLSEQLLNIHKGIHMYIHTYSIPAHHLLLPEYSVPSDRGRGPRQHIRSCDSPHRDCPNWT